MYKRQAIHCAFLVETYFKYGDAIEIVQRLFRRHFNVTHHDVSSGNTIKLWLVSTVWSGVANFGIIGPYFFQKEEQTLTATSAQYTVMLQEFLAPELYRGIDLNAVRFQQDGATAHTARASMAVVREMLPGHVIS